MERPSLSHCEVEPRTESQKEPGKIFRSLKTLERATRILSAKKGATFIAHKCMVGISQTNTTQYPRLQITNSPNQSPTASDGCSGGISEAVEAHPKRAEI